MTNRSSGWRFRRRMCRRITRNNHLIEFQKSGLLQGAIEGLRRFPDCAFRVDCLVRRIDKDSLIPTTRTLVRWSGVLRRTDLLILSGRASPPSNAQFACAMILKNYSLLAIQWIARAEKRRFVSRSARGNRHQPPMRPLVREFQPAGSVACAIRDEQPNLPDP